MRFVILILIICNVSLIKAQQTVEFPHKVGIKTSINISSILGTELQNPRPKFGYTAGAYMIFNPKNDWSYYTEAVGSFRGSKFSNGDTGYSRIASFYVDFSFLPTYNVKGDKHAIAMGPYGSYLGLSSLFIGAKKKAELNGIGLLDYDAGLALYYHKKGEVVTLQVGGKIGLLDINDGINFEGYFPKTGTDGLIRNISFEIGMLF